MTFSDRFGGSSIQPADVMYRAVTLTADQLLQWPTFATNDEVVSRLMDVVSNSPDLNMTLPDATVASKGQDVLIANLGLINFNILRNDGTFLTAVTPGQSIYIYLTDTSTAAGTWETMIFGSVVSSLDLSNAAGNGLVVASGRLAVSPITSAVAGNMVISTNDRAKFLLWTGGTGSYTLPLASDVGQFFFEARNQGTGALTITCTGGETIDGSASITLQLGESCWIHAGTGAWYSVGRGRSTQFSFTLLQKTVTGGTVTLSLTEAANVVQTYTGTLLSNVDIVLPPIVQVYYISNQTSGAFNFRLKNPGAGTTVSLPTGQNAVIFSDGTNVINASTTIAGISSLVLAAGSAGSPSLGVGASNTGLYSSGSNEVAVSSNGVQVAEFDPTGLTVIAPNGQVGVVSPTGTATINISRPAGAYGAIRYSTSGNLRWQVGVNSVAESGANAGSNWVHERYADDGVSLLGTPISINRATGAITFTGATGVVGRTVINTTALTDGLTVTDTGASGANIKLTGNGAVTPSKTIRVVAGLFQIVNNAYSTAVLSLTDAGTMTLTGDLIANNVTITSDRRKKKKIKTVVGAIDRIKKLRIVTFVDKDGAARRGVIAQEAMKIYPDAVHENTDGYLSVDYTNILCDAVAALQEVLNDDA